MSTLQEVISRFGAEAKRKLSNVSARGEPEDQLRSPLEILFSDLTELCEKSRNDLVAVGESSISELKTRPDYAITFRKALVGFVEVKAPGKGADPRRFKGHDKEQWDKLRSLPNLIYTDGNEFSLWRDGELSGDIVRLEGDVEKSGTALKAPTQIVKLFDDFLTWNPIPPKSASELARVSARLCRFLRDEVTEELGRGSDALTGLAEDWRKLLFPEADNAEFADGYAQAVTFGLLMARARNIRLSANLDTVGRELAKSNSLIGNALRLLTENASNQNTLKTSLGILTRVLDSVDWQRISKGKSDAWLYFYEDFLEVYDNKLRKMTGSYYTPPEVVESMVRLVSDALRKFLDEPLGLASRAVTIADPAVGTGTFLLGIFRHLATSIAEDQGEGAVPSAIEAMVARLIGFEIQLGPFAVAQLRIHAELFELTGKSNLPTPRMYVTDTLDNPELDQGWFPQAVAPIADSRRKANEIKKNERITVIIGNPPYKEKAKGRGGWVEPDNEHSGDPAILEDWFPPKAWGVGAHAKHLRNLYVYFWRWATWKVFDQKSGEQVNHNPGIVCFITVAGFLNGPGFQKMRDYLRRTVDHIWVIDCTPEGHQPEVPTRIFQGVQQPVCIVMVARSKNHDSGKPAEVLYSRLPEGKREVKFEALATLELEGDQWRVCASEWRAPFLPESTGAWADFPSLEDLFAYNGSGVMPGRTWIIAPDSKSLNDRWSVITNAESSQKDDLFVPHMNSGKLGDRYANRIVRLGLPGFPDNPKPISSERGSCLNPIAYGFRSFDRQWIIPDNRLINRPNPELWRVRSDKQIYLTAPSDRIPTSGPSLTISSLIPDLHHYNGRGGRVFPLFRDSNGQIPNLPPGLLPFLSKRFGLTVSAEDFMAYLAAVAAHPQFVRKFAEDLKQPGIRIPITASAGLFAESVEIGRRVIWLYTYGERFVDPKSGRKAGPPRLPKDKSPTIPRDGSIPSEPERMPDELRYDEATRRLYVGEGYIENIDATVWDYEVSGKQVIHQWFSYRKRNREKPIIGDRRPPSKLGEIQPDHWIAEYTTDLLNLIHVLGLLVEMEPKQADLLERICDSPRIDKKELVEHHALDVPEVWKKSMKPSSGDAPGSLFDALDD